MNSVLVALAAGFLATAAPSTTVAVANTMVFDRDFPAVWDAVYEALNDDHVVMKDKKAGFLQTDWIYEISPEKFIETQVNGFPRKQYFQTRHQVKVLITQQLPYKTQISVDLNFEIENLSERGEFIEWTPLSSDPSNSADLIDILESIQKLLR